MDNCAVAEQTPIAARLSSQPTQSVRYVTRRRPAPLIGIVVLF